MSFRTPRYRGADEDSELIDLPGSPSISEESTVRFPTNFSSPLRLPTVLSGTPPKPFYGNLIPKQSPKQSPHLHQPQRPASRPDYNRETRFALPPPSAKSQSFHRASSRQTDADLELVSELSEKLQEFEEDNGFPSSNPSNFNVSNPFRFVTVPPDEFMRHTSRYRKELNRLDYILEEDYSGFEDWYQEMQSRVARARKSNNHQTQSS